jgi:hypothetical protein
VHLYIGPPRYGAADPSWSGCIGGRALRAFSWTAIGRAALGFDRVTGSGTGGAGRAFDSEVTGTHASGEGSHLMRRAGINQKPSSRAAWNATAIPNHIRRRLRSKRRLLTLPSVVGNSGTLCTYPEGGGRWIGPGRLEGRMSGNFVT